MTRAALALTIALAVSVAGTGAAFAQPEVAPQQKERAQALMTEGNEALNQGDYVPALEKFERAYVLYPSPKLLLNIGTTQRLLGRDADAASTYERFLVDPGRDPARVEEVKRLLDEIDARLAAVVIRSKTAGAIVRLDGKVVGTAPLERRMRLQPGEHSISAEKPGLRTSVTTLRFAARDQPLVTVEPTSMKSGSDAQRVAAFVIGGVGIATAGVGAALGALAAVRESEASDHCATDAPTVCDSEGVALGDTARDFALGSTVTLAIGGAAFATGLVLFLTAPSDKAPPKERASLALTPRAGGAELRWVARW